MEINDLRNNNLIIFEAVMGSKAYGTSLSTSDTDIRGVFMQPLDDILEHGYVNQVSDETNDITFYELKRFISLSIDNNPNILEILFAPQDCIIQTSDIWNMLQIHCHTFLTKKCRYTFAGYAIGQIKKAKGFNKKMNWEEAKMTRKTVLDFCYVLEPKINGSMLLKNWIQYASLYNNKLNKNKNLNHQSFGLANINHVHNIYSMYLMGTENGGIVSDEERANDVQLMSISKNTPFAAYLSFNKDAYSTHCRRYKEYQTWLKERNKDRFKMNKEHGKNYDSKNLMHVFRLLNVALEIARTGHLYVRRCDEEIKILMQIRKGEYEYNTLVEKAEKMIEELDEAYENSKLPEKVDQFFANRLLLTMRKKRYSSYALDQQNCEHLSSFPI